MNLVPDPWTPLNLMMSYYFNAHVRLLKVFDVFY